MKRSGEIVRVALLSLVIALLFQMPMSAFFFRFSTQSAAAQGFANFLLGGRQEHELAVSSLRHPAGEAHADLQLERPPEDRSVALKQHTFQPTSIPHYAFVKFSSYRVSRNTFYVVGISSHVVRQWDQSNVVHTCEWHPANGSEPMAVHTAPADFVATPAHMINVDFDENGMTYVPAIVNCTFGQDVGADGKGGLLVIRVSLTYHRWDKNVPTVVLEERSGAVDVLTYPPKEKAYKYAFCGPPMHGQVPAAWIKAWLIYHNYQLGGEAHFFFYNVGGLKAADKVVFKEFLQAGLLTITDLARPEFQVDYPMWYFHQLLYINDCLQRSRLAADYALFFDFDEFLQVRPPETIQSLLEKHKDRPWLTFGNIPADFTHCRVPSETEAEFPVERMLWHDKQPECGHPDEDRWTCVAAQGRRKYVANTQLVSAGGVHRAAIPDEGGINLNASEARMIHFHGALNPRNVFCGHPVEAADLDKLTHLERDEAISQAFAYARKFPIKPRSATTRQPL